MVKVHIPSERMGCMIPSGWLIAELLIYLGPRVSVACTEAAFTAQFKDLPWIRKRAECLPQMAYLRVLRRQFCSCSGVPKVALGSRDFLPGLRGGVFCHTPEWLAQRRTLLLIWWSKMCNDRHKADETSGESADLLEGPHEFLNSKVWPKLFRGNLVKYGVSFAIGNGHGCTDMPICQKQNVIQIQCLLIHRNGSNKCRNVPKTV